MSDPHAIDPRRERLAAILIPLAFLIAALAFVIVGSEPDLPEGVAPIIPAEAITTAPRRQRPIDPPLLKVGAFSYRCSDCHQHFSADKASKADSKLVQHRDIILNHGRNDRCYNCHDQQDRNVLVLHDGTTVPFTRTPELCVKCHGTTYRDWKLGMHGRTTGSWDPRSDQKRRLTCTECHDPHRPAFDPIAPLPGPNTPRMGEQDGGGHHDFRSSLQRWLKTHQESDHDH